jgi:hypothetical protein
MKTQEIIDKRRNIQDLMKKYDDFKADYILTSEWSKYLVVLISGFLETSIQTIVMDFVNRKIHRYTSAYVSENLDYFTNPTVGKIGSLFGAFDDVWKNCIGSQVQPGNAN